MLGALALARPTALTAQADSTAARTDSLPAPVQAAPAPAQKPPPDRWAVAAEISFTDQSGNEALRLFTGGLRISHREKEAFELESTLSTRYGRSEERVVSRSHFGSLSFDLHPQERWSPFLYVTAERDLFKRLDLRMAGGAGAKYSLHRDDDSKNEVSLSLALLFTHENLAPSATDSLAPIRNLGRWSLRARAHRDLTSDVTVRHSTFVQPAWDQMADYLLRTETEATVLLTKRLALSVSHQLNRTARPPQGVAPDDRLLKTGLIIDF